MRLMYQEPKLEFSCANPLDIPECASQKHANDVSHKSGMAKNVDHLWRIEQVDDCKTCYDLSLPHRPGTAELVKLSSLFLNSVFC
jgi:hypothetical protein